MAASSSSHGSLHEVMQRAVAAVDAQPVRAPERRATPRVPCGIPVGVRLHGDQVGAIARDLSSGGMSMDLRGGVELGEILVLEFEPPAAGFTVSCVGLVRSVRPVDGGARVGIEFHNLAPAARRELAGWVRARLSGPANDARSHWEGRGDMGEAAPVAPGPQILRWHIPFAGLWPAIANLLSASTTFFVPTSTTEAREGDRVILEIVPPDTHTVVQLQAEVTWVAEDGLGVRHAGLTHADRAILASITAHFLREEARYR